jgi:hypothetical protein
MPATPRRLPRIPKSRRVDVTRAEFDRVIDLLNERGEIIEKMRRDLETQFTRIAQLQAEFDLMKRKRQ